jgi:glucose/arabinose dehydrogenase
MPTYVAQAPGHPNLLFVVEKEGTIAVERGAKQITHPFLDITDRVTSPDEQGLLSLAFDPRYRKNGRFYVYYTNKHCTSGGACNVEVDSFTTSKNTPLRADPSSRRRIIEITHDQAPNHNGGTVAFGPDGDMYLAVGDGGTQPDPENDAQTTHDLLGKLLRIKPKAGGGYTVPKSNPYVGKPGRDEIFSIGLRNPFRFSFDSKTGDIWIADVGWNTWEEIDRAKLSQANGANFGWHIFEGPDPCSGCGFGPGTDPPPHYIGPVHSYPHNAPSGEKGSVIIGGVMVRSASLPSLRGRYVYSDNYVGDLRSYNPASHKETELGPTIDGPSSIVTGLDGSVYVTALYTDRVYKLVDSSANPVQPKARPPAHPGDGRGGVRLAKLGNFDSPDYVTSAPGVRGTTYVVQRAGKVIAFRHGHKHTFLNITKRTTTDGERGLLSIAFDPHFQRNHLFYSYSTDRKGNIEIDEFHAASPRQANRKSRRTVITIPHPGQSNHNGGTAQFGPDGLLYFGTGDGGAAGDPPENAQNKKVLLGKLIRINPHRHRGKPYTVPKSNPFVGRKGRNEIYALGLRNPFRFSFDRRTHHILIGDVGQDSWEEVDYESRHRLRGANFGWDHFEGRHRFDYPGDNEARRPKHNYRPPIHEYSHAGGRCAIIGGYVVRDHAVRSLDGRYLYEDRCTGQLRSLVPHRKRAKGDRALGLTVPDPGGFGLAHGHVYAASLDGPVYRLSSKK